MAYNLGELCLHIGYLREAAAWFQQVAHEVIDPEAQRPLVEAAARHVGTKAPTRST
jgi:hypothetical protein